MPSLLPNGSLAAQKGSTNISLPLKDLSASGESKEPARPQTAETDTNYGREGINIKSGSTPEWLESSLKVAALDKPVTAISHLGGLVPLGRTELLGRPLSTLSPITPRQDSTILETVVQSTDLLKIPSGGSTLSLKDDHSLKLQAPIVAPKATVFGGSSSPSATVKSAVPYEMANEIEEISDDFEMNNSDGEDDEFFKMPIRIQPTAAEASLAPISKTQTTSDKSIRPSDKSDPKLAQDTPPIARLHATGFGTDGLTASTLTPVTADLQLEKREPELNKKQFVPLMPLLSVPVKPSLLADLPPIGIKTASTTAAMTNNGAKDTHGFKSHRSEFHDDYSDDYGAGHTDDDGFEDDADIVFSDDGLSLDGDSMESPTHRYRLGNAKNDNDLF
ncbi:hypothetical protein BASA62_001109 [Batrachochytrium salamandrivorans]|nr:hypothetical protein BASA62_001109 [Batrachochytrium salamandrivorans]